MRRAAPLAVALGLLAAAPAPVHAALPTAAGCHAAWPVTPFLAGHGTTYPAHVKRLPIACGVSIGYPASETTLAISNRGAILFSPANSENTLARSGDGGATWGLVGPQQLQYTSLWNTVDPQVVVDRRTGRVFWVHATHTDELSGPLPDQSPASWLAPTAIANAHGFQVFSSDDNGSTWTTADYSREFTADWEKVFVGPAPRTAGAAQPQDYPDVVYLCANAPLEVTGPGRVCYRSLDGGVTFTTTGYMFPSQSAPVGCPPLAANTGVVTSDGTVYVPQSCRGGTYLVASRDEGGSWTWLPVAGAPAANGLGAVVQLAIDQSDNLYVLWSASDALHLTVSRNGGRTWGPPLVVSPPGLHDFTLPALAAGPTGAVGVTYYASTHSTSMQPLSGYVSQTTDALASRPLFYSGSVNDPARPIFTNYGDEYSPRADFIGAAYDAGGNFWAGLVRQLGPPDPSNRIVTTGYVGRLSFP